MGDLVLGQVISVGDRISTLELSLVIKKEKEKWVFYPLRERAHAYLFKGDTNYPCVSLAEILKIGDIVLGRVKIDWFFPVFISFDDKVTGVVSALCSQCGTILPTPKNFDFLACPKCKTTRKTKISHLYNPLLWREIHKLHRIKTLPPA